MLDFMKAVMYNGDDNFLKNVKSRSIRRVISAIVVFLIVATVQLSFSILGNNTSNSVIACMECFINNDCGHKYATNYDKKAKKCGDHGDASSCNNDSEHSCIWDYSGNYCTFKTVNTEYAKTCADHGSLEECIKDKEHGCSWSYNGNYCETKSYTMGSNTNSSNATNNENSENACYICEDANGKIYGNWSANNPDTLKCYVVNNTKEECDKIIDNTNSSNAEKKYCKDYSVDDCPKKDDYGNKCTRIAGMGNTGSCAKL